MRSLPTATDILIVGAGPTGLTLAAELRRDGAEPLIVDRLPAVANTPRACVVHARTMEVLEPLGATRDLLELGVKVPIFRIRDRDHTLITIDFSEIPSEYPFTLMCPQDRVERCLEAHLKSLGGAVIRPCQVVGIAEADSHVDVQVRDGDAVQTIRARWLIGCDGMHSIVRTQAGIPFAGAAYEQDFVLADVRMQWPLSREEVTLFYSPAGLMAVAPLPEDHYRIVAFFQNLGANGRTCFSCHQPQNGWTISAADVAARFAASAGTDPIFRVVDGATCPSDDVSTFAAKQLAYKLLIDRGLIRIGLPIPAGAQFAVTAVDDPYNCNTNPVTGLTSATTGIVSTYRRPLPSTNLGFLSAIMWDGREPSLTSQATDATLGHAQASTPPTAAQLAEIVAFESGIFAAQAFDDRAGSLAADGSTGGPVALSLQLPNFFIGVDDPLGQNPHHVQFTSQIFDLYRPWLAPSHHEDTAKRQSIARGEEVFNNTTINIRGVSGLNDDLNVASIPGFCGTCHDTPNVGDHSVKAPLDIGIPDAGVNKPPVLDISGLPVFTLTCTQGPLAGQIYKVTDAGRAMISGQCKDIGRFKGPVLRGLASRAPYFHNGSAATLLDVVNFYDQRFGIGFTDQQKADLVNFLNAL